MYLSNADPTDIVVILSSLVRFQGMAVQPAIAPNKTANSITLRGTPNIVAILEKVIEENDKPRAEIVVDVEILEVNSQRAKTYGLNLTQYAVGGIFSPEVSSGRRRPPRRRRQGRRRPRPGRRAWRRTRSARRRCST